MQHRDPRSSDPRKIEADIERDRAALASSLDALADRFSADSLTRDAVGLLRDNAAGLTRSVDRVVRSNPLAVAVTGVGLAWLLLGGRRDPQPPIDTLSGTLHEALSRWDDDGGPVPEDAAPFEGTPADLAAEADWSRAGDSLRRRANEALRRIEARARQGLTPAREIAAERAAVLARLAEDLKETFRSGLGGLPEAAQSRIAAAREAAFAARMRAERGARSAGRVVEEHPMATGAAALALGVAVAAMLPRTRVEDQAFGAQRDLLMDEAARILREERDRAARTAQTLAADLRGDAAAAAEKVVATVARVAEPAV